MTLGSQEWLGPPNLNKDRTADGSRALRCARECSAHKLLAAPSLAGLFRTELKDQEGDKLI